MASLHMKRKLKGYRKKRPLIIPITFTLESPRKEKPSTELLQELVGSAFNSRHGEGCKSGPPGCPQLDVHIENQRGVVAVGDDVDT